MKKFKDLNRLFDAVNDHPTPGLNLIPKIYVKSYLKIVQFGGSEINEKLYEFAEWLELIEIEGELISITQKGRDFSSLNPELIYELNENQKRFLRTIYLNTNKDNLEPFFKQFEFRDEYIIYIRKEFDPKYQNLFQDMEFLGIIKKNNDNLYTIKEKYWSIILTREICDPDVNQTEIWTTAVKPEDAPLIEPTYINDQEVNIEVNHQFRAQISESTSLNRKLIGYWGEAYIYNILSNQLENKYQNFEKINFSNGFCIKNQATIIAKLIWWNRYEESYKDHDLYIFSEENEIYIEVKTTSLNRKIFTISSNELELAKEKRENYHLYHIVNAGTSNVSYFIFENFFEYYTRNFFKIASFTLEFL